MHIHWHLDDFGKEYHQINSDGKEITLHGEVGRLRPAESAQSDSGRPILNGIKLLPETGRGYN